jgi:hypothetical protein
MESVLSCGKNQAVMTNINTINNDYDYDIEKLYYYKYLKRYCMECVWLRKEKLIIIKINT